jgi:hypothetical protein
MIPNNLFGNDTEELSHDYFQAAMMGYSRMRDFGS